MHMPNELPVPPQAERVSKMSPDPSALHVLRPLGSNPDKIRVKRSRKKDAICLKKVSE